MVNPQLIRARALALGSFAINFACQLYGSLTSPNMKDVADANHYAFSPNPYFIGAFFLPQALFQLYWIKTLFTASSEKPDPKYQHSVTFPTAVGGGLKGTDGTVDVLSVNPNDPEPTQMAYVPIFALGNLCIAGWMVFWMQENFWASQALVIINSSVQLYAVYYLLSPSSAFKVTAQNWQTHVVAKMFAGIGVLDLIDNGGVALRYAGPPSAVVQVATVVIFFALHATTRGSPDLTFSLCLLYDVVALFFGHRGETSWSWTLAFTAIGLIAGIGSQSLVHRNKVLGIQENTAGAQGGENVSGD